MSSQKSAQNLVLGAALFGDVGTSGVRITDLEGVNRMLDVFQAHGHKDMDTSRAYSSGTAEKYLAKADWESRGLVLDTKIFPMLSKGITLTPENMRTVLTTSLKELNAKKVHIWYLHAPDRTTPFEVTMKGVNELYKEGLFEKFGLSNFMSWEVARIVEICDANGYVKPTVYQGVYSAFQRSIEPELIPCLRHYNIAFYAYSPLGGGILTGNIRRDEPVEPGSRFDEAAGYGKSFRARYWKDQYFEAVENVRKTAEAHGLTLAEVALRWISHHSVLKRELGDAVVVGASSAGQLEKNLVDLEKGILPDDILEALNEGWSHVLPAAGKYWF